MNQFKDYFTRQDAAAVPARDHRAEVRARRRQAQRPRERRPHRAPPHVLRDARQLLVRRLLQARRDRLRLRAADEGLRDRSEAPRLHGARVGRGGARALEEGRRRRRRPRHLARRQGQLLGDGRHRPVRPVQRDPLPAERRHPLRRGGRRPQVPGAGLRLRSLGRDLEPGVHAVRAGRPGRSPPAAEAVGRHRHGPRAPLRRAARRALDVRDRSGPAADRARREAVGQELRPDRLRGHERLAARDRRPRARRRVPDRRRRASPTRPGASTCCAGSCGGASITAGCSASKQPFLHEIAGDVDRDDGRRLPGAGRAREPDREDLPRRGDALPRDAGARRAHPDDAMAGARTRRPSRASSRSSSTTPTASRST